MFNVVRTSHLVSSNCLSRLHSNAINVFLYIIHQFLFVGNTAFRRLDSVSVFRWDLLSLAQSIQLVLISGSQHQHKIGYINQAQHKTSAKVKTNFKNITGTPHTLGLPPISMYYFAAIFVKIRVLAEQKS
jgi:hypothetical protein